MRIDKYQVRKDSLIIPLITFAVLILAFGYAGKLYRDQLVSNERASVETFLRPYANSLTTIITHRTALIDALVVFARAHPDREGLIGHFQHFAEGLYLSENSVREIEIFAPQTAHLKYSGGDVRSSAPLSIAEYIQKEPSETRADIERTIRTSKITLSGPFELPDGSLVLVEWQAIYHGDTLWGFAAVTFDFNELLINSGLPPANTNLEIALIKDSGELIFGAPETLTTSPVRFQIDLPEGYWELAAAPQGGWNSAVQPGWISFIGFSSLFILLAVLTAYGFSNYQTRLRAAVRQRTAELVEEIKERQLAEETVQKINRVYTILNDLNQAILRSPDSPDLCQRFCEIAVEKGGYGLVWVGLLSASSQKLKPVASSGRGAEALEEIDITPSSTPLAYSPIDRALLSAQHQVCNDVPNTEPSTPHLQFALHYGFASMASFPLMVDGQIRGVISLYSSGPNHFDDAEIEILDDLALSLSFAMKFSELQEQHRWAEAETRQINLLYQVLSQVNQQVLRTTTREELFKNICQIAVETGQFKLAWIAWVDSDSRTIQPVASAGDTSGILEKMIIPLDDPAGISGPLCTAIHTGDVYTSIYFENTLWENLAEQIGFAAMGSFPIRMRGNVCAALNIHVETRDYFRIKEINLLREVSDDISFALDFQLQEAYRKQTELAVANQNRLLTALINSPADIMIFSLDRNYCYLTFNERHRQEMRKTWGIEIAPGLNMLNIIADAGLRAAAKQSFDRALAGEAYTEVQHQPGADLYYQFSWNPIVTDQGEVTGLTAFVQDITEQTKVAERIEKSELRYRLAQQAARIGSWEWDIPSDRLTWSDEMFAIFEKDPHTFIPTNQAVIDSILDEDKPTALAAVDASLTRGVPFLIEYRICVPGQRIKWVEARGEVIFDDQKRPLRAAGTVQDITKRKLAEEALRESEARYRDLFLGNPQPMWVSDVETLQFLDVNDAAIAKYGYSRDEFLSMTIKDIRPAEDIPVMLERINKQPYENLGVWRHRLKDGRIIQVEISSHLLNYAGRPARLVMALDVTERMAAETKIRELNATLEKRVAERTAQLEASNKELEAFAYSVSHDLRAPLRAIDGFSRILQQDYADILNDEGRRLLGIIRENTSKMDQLITDLLALSRVSRSQLSPAVIDMTAMASSVYHEIATPEVERKVVFDLKELPAAAGDPTLMRQVWTNLISNAIKYSMPKDTCRIEISGMEQDGICTYSIRDNGVGFNPRYIDKLFGLFQRLHKSGEFEGTGVGLAIVQRIIHRHGGQVWAEGEVGRGATFYFSVPQRLVKHE